VQSLVRAQFKDWTAVVIAHRLETIVDFDKILVLEDGRIVEYGNPQQLLQRDGVFKSLWNHQEG
jgi:ATP-binding cassette, subfamily C (CFTR/MRP), member 1